MIYENFKSYIQKYVALNFVEWNLVKLRLKVKHFKKGDIIHNIGDISRQIYFINSGLARAYTIDENGKDYTWSLFFNDENSHTVNLFVVDYDSFINQTPSRLEIEVLEDCEVLEVGYDDFFFINNNSKKMKHFTQVMVDFAYSYLHNIVLDRQTKTAKQRFEEFMQQTPHLLEKVPQYHIATFLSITPQHLSRLKKSY